MLALDMTELDEAGLKKAVCDYLTPFGRPTIIKIMPREDTHQYGVVAVKMSTMDEARRLARCLGHSQYGSIVVIRLAQPGCSAPGAANAAQFE